jgi:serine/threonine protein kinase
MKLIGQEIFTWATLSHENICPLIGAYVKEGRFFHVYPHGENNTLLEWRHKTNRSVNEIQEHVSGSIYYSGALISLVQMLEVARAIQHMHLSGICLSDSIKGVCIFCICSIKELTK